MNGAGPSAASCLLRRVNEAAARLYPSPLRGRQTTGRTRIMQRLRRWDCSQEIGPPFDGGPAFVMKPLKYASNMGVPPRTFQYHFRGNCESLCSHRVASSQLPPRSRWDRRPPRSHANQPALNPAQTLPHSTAPVPERSFKLDMIASIRATTERPVLTNQFAQSMGSNNYRNTRRYRGFARAGEFRSAPATSRQARRPGAMREGLTPLFRCDAIFFLRKCPSLRAAGSSLLC